MLQTVMSPKVLNIEKLERKFASLTKSRESIQGLSMWIIRHKEFYKDIVNQWLEALTRDLNALTMFYVANDVIQNCGRKRAPEFRDAFATVLEKAMCLEKVREIKNEVTRMITLWHERAIYDDTFFKTLQDKLNTVNEQPQIEIEEKELSEAEVIENFKLEKLISSLRKLKTLEDELLEKEAFLEDIEEPGMSNIDNLIVKMDSQKEMQKFDKFQNLVEDYLSLSEKVLLAKKAALLNLKYSSIFYSAQHEDAKKVAHAYRIYGKKVKMLEKSLSEKLATFPEPSPILSEKSPDVELMSNQELESFSADSKILETELNIDTADKKYKSPTSESQSLPLAVSTENNTNIDNIWKSPSFLDTSKSNSSENISKSPTVADTSKSPNHEKVMKSPLIMDTTKNASSEADMLKTSTVDNVMRSACDDKKELKAIHPSVSHLIKDSSSLEIKVDSSVDKTENSDSKETPNTELQTLPDVECIDFLLEKAYDNHQVKSKLSFKRKIDNLLKSKQNKVCKLSNEEDNNSGDNIVNNNQDNISPDFDFSENLMQNVSFLVKNETNFENINKIESLLKRNENDIDPESSNDAKINKIPNTEQTGDCKSEQDKEMVQSTQTFDLIDSKNMSSTSFALNSLPDIPTELLKNILDKNRKNMNTSLNDDLHPSSDKANFIAENKDPSNVNLGNSSNSSITGNPNSPSKNLDPDSKILNNTNIKNVCDETTKEAQDNEFQKSLSSTDSLSSVSNSQKKCFVKSTNFLKNLQDVLQCFTKKDTSINKLRCSETLKSLPSVHLENTLNVYSCIMQSCDSNSLNSTTLNSSISGNANSNVPTKNLLNDEKHSSFETEINHNFQGNLSTSKDLSLLDENKSRFNEFSSKDDNLEIMDMEVDSDEEDTK